MLDIRAELREVTNNYERSNRQMIERAWQRFDKKISAYNHKDTTSKKTRPTSR
jgi:dsDNA-specific endonuclease/ATPase MutS2